ncbi:hypothetical protein AYI70_g4648 [Smittium culicis]|uniref:Uncharacterized protein n=1 Tax=Smittium culicis TaxID=133412 RepID=A0A1R1XY90_9FUNG|nr:hypothetical protein AYI70_g4648 [Smittium culicis]
MSENMLPPRYKGDGLDIYPAELWCNVFLSIAAVKKWTERTTVIMLLRHTGGPARKYMMQLFKLACLVNAEDTYEISTWTKILINKFRSLASSDVNTLMGDVVKRVRLIVNTLSISRSYEMPKKQKVAIHAPKGNLNCNNISSTEGITITVPGYLVQKALIKRNLNVSTYENKYEVQRKGLPRKLRSEHGKQRALQGNLKTKPYNLTPINKLDSWRSRNMNPSYSTTENELSVHSNTSESKESKALLSYSAYAQPDCGLSGYLQFVKKPIESHSKKSEILNESILKSINRSGSVKRARITNNNRSDNKNKLSVKSASLRNAISKQEILNLNSKPNENDLYESSIRKSKQPVVKESTEAKEPRNKISFTSNENKKLFYDILYNRFEPTSTEKSTSNNDSIESKVSSSKRLKGKSSTLKDDEISNMKNNHHKVNSRNIKSETSNEIRIESHSETLKLNEQQNEDDIKREIIRKKLLASGYVFKDKKSKLHSSAKMDNNITKRNVVSKPTVNINIGMLRSLGY